MNVVKLNVGGSPPGNLLFELSRNGHMLIKTENQVDSTMEALVSDTPSLEQILPSELVRELRQWNLDNPSPGILAISPGDSILNSIPWEYLPQLYQLQNIFVVRLVEESEKIQKTPNAENKEIMAVGWSGAPNFNIPGINNELDALLALGSETNQKVHILTEPSLDQLSQAYSDIRPLILHLILPGLLYDNQIPVLAISGVDEIQRVNIDHFLNVLQSNHHSRLVVINTCNSGYSDTGPSVTEIVTKQLGCMSVGWLGFVQDQAAFDFSLFFYTRLLEGVSVMDALLAYNSLKLKGRNPELATRGVSSQEGPLSMRLEPIPTVYSPSIPYLTESLVKPDLKKMFDEGFTREQQPKSKPRSTPSGFPSPSPFRPSTSPHQKRYSMPHRPSPSSIPASSPRSRPSQSPFQPFHGLDSYTPVEIITVPKVEMEFQPQPWLNPALLKNGRPAILQLSLKPDRSIQNVRLTITCDTGKGSSTIKQTINLEKGHQPISVDTFQFPILYQLIQDNISRRQINFTITCHWGSILLAEMTRPALWMDRTEWLDKPDTWHFIPAFVQPYADGVLDVIDKAGPILKTLVSPESVFLGYQKGNNEYVSKEVEAIFNCLRDKPFELNYISSPPLRVYTPGNFISSGQRVRSPNKVIERKRGTCHDLSILLASCLEHIGIYPLIFLIHRHTFTGYWNNSQAHQEYWDMVRKDIMCHTQGPGREWTIRDPNEIIKLVQNEYITCFDGTEVTKRIAQFIHSTHHGRDHLNRQELFDVAIDIQASRREIQPL